MSEYVHKSLSNCFLSIKLEYRQFYLSILIVNPNTLRCVMYDLYQLQGTSVEVN